MLRQFLFILIIGLLMIAQRPTGADRGPRQTIYLPLVLVDEASYKRCLAWAWMHLMEPGDAQRLQVACYHNWWVGDNPLASLGIERVQFLYCDAWYGNGRRHDALQAADDYLAAGFAGPLLIFNEPDLPLPQCELSPAKAAYLYHEIRQRWPAAQLIGPNVSHGDYLAGWTWLSAWFDEVITITGKPPQIYAYALHAYPDEPPHLIVDSLHDWMQERGQDGRPIWVTEFGSCRPDQVHELMTWYEQDERIERYFYYSPILEDGDPWSCMRLLEPFDVPRGLTTVGQVWVGWQGHHEQE